MIIALVLTLAGCFEAKSINLNWHKADATPEEYGKDRYECESQANAQAAAKTGVVAMSGTLVYENTRSNEFERCMRYRGYSAGSRQ